MNMRVGRLWPVALMAAAMAPAAPGVDWNEGINGDLSGDRFSPTSLGVLGAGANTVTATSVLGDIEYMTFNVPQGMVLSSLILKAYSAPNTISFVAVQQGTVFTEDPNNPDV